MSAARTKSERKREAILRAAAVEFQANGFRATSMDRIAERALVSKRTVYNHFSSKEELFKTISKDLLVRVHRFTEHPFVADGSLEEQLVAIGLREAEMVTSGEFLGMSRVILAESIRSPRLARELLDELQKGESGVERWIREAVGAGHLEVEDPALAAEQFTGLIKASLFWPRLIADAGPAVEPERRAVVRSAVAMFLDHYRPRGEGGA